jgi:DNA-binding response OmpR family regulator
MTPDAPGRPKDDGINHPVDVPDLRSLRVRQSVILVADDEAVIRDPVTLLLQREGYFVLSAADGHEGLELSRKYPGTIDLVITDVNMPRMNGTDLCRHLMEERPGIKMLMMSGATVREVVWPNANMPFLPKPFDRETLKTQVRRLLGGSNSSSAASTTISPAEVNFGTR